MHPRHFYFAGRRHAFPAKQAQVLCCLLRRPRFPLADDLVARAVYGRAARHGNTPLVRARLRKLVFDLNEGLILRGLRMQVVRPTMRRLVLEFYPPR
jgi:hypothetical protein